jgi:hypothetical protein
MTSKPLTPTDRARWLAGMPKGSTLPDNVREIPYTAHGAVTAIQAGDVLELLTLDTRALLEAADAEVAAAVAPLQTALVLAGLTEERATLEAFGALGVEPLLKEMREAALKGKPISTEAEWQLDQIKAEATKRAQRCAEVQREGGDVSAIVAAAWGER